jgi:hypothetical protein
VRYDVWKLVIYFGEPFCLPVHSNVVKLGFYVFEGTISNECKIKEMKIHVAIEITHTKLIVY